MSIFWIVIFTALIISLIIISLISCWKVFQNQNNKGPLENELRELQSQIQGQIQGGNEKQLQLIRAEIQDSARLGRTEASQNQSQNQQLLGSQLSSMASLLTQQIDSFGKVLSHFNEQITQRFDAMYSGLNEQARLARHEQGQSLKIFGETLNQQLTQLSAQSDLRFAEIRTTLEKKLKDIEMNNASKLEEMRQTVDEKLHATLEQRLDKSFQMVSERLEQVHRGLGEMQNLANGVGDLKKVLVNVKTRGTWGEVQLDSLLQQALAPEQYQKNVAVKPHSNERVDFAICLPGQSVNGDKPVWLPIDAKFPREDYERLIDAQDRADLVAIEETGRALELRIKLEAKSIADKYIAPPHTTDFAILFLPTEGLYAEVLRRPGLSDMLQRDCRITIAGPTTLWALLNSLQMGFRTLTIEKRSSEVWQVLGAIKTEFSKFGDVLSRTRSQLETVTRSIDMAERRSRAMDRRLRHVEAVPGEEAKTCLGDNYAVLDTTLKNHQEENN